LAVSLSALFPGLGHVYLGERDKAAILAGSTVAEFGSIYGFGKFHEWEGVRLSTVTLEATWSYGIYAAYRDTRLNNGLSHYTYKMPLDSFADISSAPFKWNVIKKPEVWGGFLGAFACAAAIGYLANEPTDAATVREVSLPFAAFPIGVGEECLFRGFLQSALSEALGPVGGITLTSLAFGAAHIPNASGFSKQARRNYYTFVVPFITAFGGYFGWMTHKNQSLKESVALHAWYDFALFALDVAFSEASTSRPSFSISLPL
jgi:hypothetical protein